MIIRLGLKNVFLFPSQICHLSWKREVGRPFRLRPTLTVDKRGHEPDIKKINEILVRNARIDFQTPFFELVQNSSLVRFLYLLRLSNFCKASRDMRKFPQKCQKIAGVESVPFMYATSDRLDTWLIPSGTTGSRQYYGSTMV